MSAKPISTAPNVLNVTITRTSDGLQEYIQVMHQDQVSVNVVLVADKIFVRDDR